ncbi:uncharacterized protein LOC135205137 [Macrobrachium nipponense]|uniref:uncharacterized protein LOC135205137 n=1 Tax=Macrobrachium nipponense TaxID=159736 RepID=UPI0030C86597
MKVIGVDSRKVRAIAEFPKPQNITDLRSFMGLTNQLGSFSSAIAAAAQPLRDLLKPRNEWCWTPQHDMAFEKTKEALIAPPVLAHFGCIVLPTMLKLTHPSYMVWGLFCCNNMERLGSSSSVDPGF